MKGTLAALILLLGILVIYNNQWTLSNPPVIEEAKAKAEHEIFMLAKIESLNRWIVEPYVPWKKLKDYIIRVLNGEMMGHDAPFVFIHVVKTTHDDNRLCKQNGYLAVTFFLVQPKKHMHKKFFMALHRFYQC